MLEKIISSFIIPFVVGPIVRAIVTYGMEYWRNWMEKKRATIPAAVGSVGKSGPLGKNNSRLCLDRTFGCFYVYSLLT